MTTEEEEYYDSIDDSEFSECRSFCNEKFREEDSEVDEEDYGRINQLVPSFIYTGNVHLSQINPPCRIDSKSNSVTTIARAKKLKRRAPLISLIDRRKNRSYLTLFYARNGQQIQPDSAQSSKATCVESPKSNITCEFDDTSDSLYSRFMDKEDPADSHNAHNTQSTSDVDNRCGSETTMGSKLFSVSVANVNSLAPSRQYFKREGPKRKYNKYYPRAGELGGLGPNIAQEKLELLRKRQDYGKTVSEKNRINIMEKKVIQKLKQEIRKSNKF